MGVDATARAEVMLCSVGVELVNGEQFAALSNVDAVQIRGHRNRPAHATVRTRTTPRRTKPISQPCCEPHPTAMAGAADRIYGGLNPRLLIQNARHSPNRFRIFHELTLRAFAQAHGLQRFPALDALRQCTANLCDEASLILGISQSSRGEFGGAKVEIGSGQLGVLPHRLAGSDSRITDDLGGRRARLKEALLLDDPAVAKDLHVLRSRLPVGSTLLPLDGHSLATGALEDDLVPDLRLGEGLGDRAFDVLPPDLARAVTRLQSHEIGGLLVRIMSVSIPGVIEKLPDDALARFSAGCGRAR